MSVSERPLPAPEPLREPLRAWWAGDARYLAVLIDGLKPTRLALTERLWWELSTLGGAVLGQLDVAQGQDVLPSSLDGCFMHLTGGPPRTLASLDALKERWLRHLEQPATLLAHRQALRLTLDSLLAGAHPQPDAAFVLLRHHTDAPANLLGGRPVLAPLGPATLDSVRHELQGLSARLQADPDLSSSLRESEGSPSVHRRDLGWRLRHLPPT